MEKQERTNKDGSKVKQQAKEIKNFDKVQGFHIGETKDERK